LIGRPTKTPMPQECADLIGDRRRQDHPGVLLRSEN
jgi:hypothetical protein